MEERENRVLFTPTLKATPAIADLQAIYSLYHSLVSEDNIDSGDHTLSDSETPSGIIRVITVMCAVDKVSAIDLIELQPYTGSGFMTCRNIVNAAARQACDFSGLFPLGESHFVKALFKGCSAGDGISLIVEGYDVKLY